MILGTRLLLKGIQWSLVARGLAPGGKTQKFIDSEVIRRMDPYTPFRSGQLKRSPTGATKIGSGKVVSQTPYAKRLYYNPQYHFEGAPMRGGKWFERMKADHRDSILRGAIKIAGGK